MRKITVLEALAMNGGDAYALLGVDKETKLLKKRPIITPVVEESVVEPIIEKVVTDYDVFVAWCEKEFNRTPTMQDYREAIEYYGSIALTAI